MKTIIIDDEKWFTQASFNDIKMLGIRALGIPAASFSSTQSEQFKRALVRQTFVQKCDYGQVINIEEISNPFGQPKRKRSATKVDLVGKYAFIKNGLRAPDKDIRWEMMKVLEEHTSFEEATTEFDKRYGANTKFKSTGKAFFDFYGLTNWALKNNWIERI